MSTIFYSWQSDLHPKTNKYFVEGCLKKAVKKLNRDEDIFFPERREKEEFEVDRDTKNVPGSPKIVETILNKISSCSVFLADLSYIGKGKKRHCSNPNVLIEYGYALGALPDSKLMAVMNTAYGDPSENELPFDMRHTRGPICFCLPEDSSKEEINGVREQLTNDLFNALKLILNEPSPKVEDELFEPTPSTYQKSTYFDKGELAGSVTGRFGTGMDLPFYSERHSYLRIYPKYKVEPFSSLQETSNYSHKFFPLGRAVSGCNFGRNRFGPYSVQNDKDSFFSLAQLFKSKEFWAIDSWTLDPKNYPQQSPPHVGILDFETYIRELKGSLKSYIERYQKEIEVEPPYVVHIGLIGIKNYRLFWKREGRFFNDEIERTYLFDGEEWTVEKILQDYFDYVADQAG